VNEQRHWKWLAGEVPKWLEKGILTSEQAHRLLAEAPATHAGHSLLTRILIAISALLFGLGVISFFAFNWQDMPKWLKLATIFTAFLAAHGGGYIYGQIREKNTLAEFFHLLGTLLFGAGIMLVAQIYHINDHFPNGVLLWSGGALLMAYVLDSTPQMFIYGALLIVWQSLERSYDLPQVWAAGYAAAGLVPFAIRKKNGLAVSIATVSLVVVLAIQLSYYRLGINGNLYFLGGGALALAWLLRRSTAAACAAPLEIVGGILYFSMLITFTFGEGVKAGLIKGWFNPEVTSLYFPGFIVALILGLWLATFFPLNTLADRYRKSDHRHSLLAFPGLVIAGLIWLMAQFTDVASYRSELVSLAMVLFNLLALVHGIVLIFSGTRGGRIGISFLGCLLVVTIILSRFAAYSDDLLMRSIAFIIAGAFILTIALKTSKRKKGQMIHAKI
jgi:uncharacterized membrane protein